jgi:hypothetical protein
VQACADLFIRFAACGLRHPFFPIEMAGDNAIISILVSGIGAPQEQDVVFTEQEEVHCHTRLAPLVSLHRTHKGHEDAYARRNALLQGMAA